MSVMPSVGAIAWLAHTWHLQRAPGRPAARAGRYEVRCMGPCIRPTHKRTICTRARLYFDGTFAGFQAGILLRRLESSNGHHDNIGVYVAQARASGSVHGSVDGFEGALAGHVDLDASSFGGIRTMLVRRTGISTRYFKEPIFSVLRTPSVASALRRTEAPSRVRLKPAIRSRWRRG